MNGGSDADHSNDRATRYEYDPVSRLEELVERSATQFDVLTTTFAYNPASQIRTRTREPTDLALYRIEAPGGDAKRPG